VRLGGGASLHLGGLDVEPALRDSPCWVDLAHQAINHDVGGHDDFSKRTYGHSCGWSDLDAGT